jgi:XTP/dITP diphosphohydrolase
VSAPASRPAPASARAHRQIEGALVIATHNSGKLAELRELLAPFGIKAQSAGELGLGEPDETGTTFAENARIKALAAALAAGEPAFADDSGLAVEALGGAPGIHSARWAGETKDFAAAMRRIENELEAHSERTADERRAHFVCALCVAWPDRHLEEFAGRVSGTLVWPPRGTTGFGYDPIFLPDGHDRTFGEMTSTEKHGLPPLGLGLSHRARAFRQLAEACLGGR